MEEVGPGDAGRLGDRPDASRSSQAKIDGIATTPISLISLLWQAYLWFDVDRRLITGSGFGDR